MRSFELVAASIFLAAGVWVANAGGTSGIEIDEIVTGAVGRMGETFVMRAAGSDSSCYVVKELEPLNGLTPVVIHGGCEDFIPNVHRIRFWRDLDDGSVELLGATSETVVSFGVGDGVTFESYRPVAPILSLAQLM